MVGNMKILRLISFMSILSLLFMGMLLGDAQYKSDTRTNTTRDFYNYTQSEIVINDSDYLPIYKYNSSINNTGLYYEKRVTNIINYFVNGMFNILIEFGRIGAEIGYNISSSVNVILLMNIFKLVLILMCVFFSSFPLIFLILIFNKIYEKIIDKGKK